MFYDGSVQAGIALALQESKAVLCFVCDQGAESILWKNEYLKDARVEKMISSHAVALQIESGSEEATFLAAYYPVRAVPTVMIIRNGQLITQLTPGVTSSIFKGRILTSLVSNQPEVATLEVAETAASTASSSNLTSDTPDNTNAGDAESTSQQSRPSPAVQNLLEERRKRLEAEKKEKDAAEKADRKAKAEARNEAITSAPGSAKAKQATYAQQQRKRQLEAKAERERILRQIEHDKLERKEKEDRRKALLASTSTNDSDVHNGDETVDEEVAVNPPEKGISRSKECAVQVRLYDGSTIRKRFPVDRNLREVREWVDFERSDDSPYTLKQILSPLPNRSLTISEENDTLDQLNFIPSATLVMIPVQGYTAAYHDASPGIVARGMSAGYSTLAAGAGLVSGAIGTFLGLGQVAAPAQTPADQGQEETSPSPQPNPSRTSNNIRTMRDQREKSDRHQLYNGNQLNFEPRKDEEKKDA